MSIWNKVLLGFIFILTIAAFYFGLRVLKIQDAWRQNAKAYESANDRADQKITDLTNGTSEDEQGVRHYRVELNKMMSHRGRVWRNVMPSGMNPGPLPRVTVTFAAPAPPVGDMLDEGPAAAPATPPAGHGINDGEVLYAFEQKSPADGGQYLGVFVAVGVTPGQVVLQSTRQLSQRESARLQASAGSGEPWVLRVAMPLDSPKNLAHLSEDEIRAMFPDATEDEYIDSPDTRPLRDYTGRFTHYYQKRLDLESERQDLTDNLASLQTAHELAVETVEFRQKQKDATIEKIKVADAERDLVEASRKKLEDRIDELDKQIADTKVQNQAMANEIARLQLGAIQTVDARTEGMAP